MPVGINREDLGADVYAHLVKLPISPSARKVEIRAGRIRPNILGNDSILVLQCHCMIFAFLPPDDVRGRILNQELILQKWRLAG